MMSITLANQAVGGWSEIASATIGAWPVAFELPGWWPVAALVLVAVLCIIAALILAARQSRAAMLTIRGVGLERLRRHEEALADCNRALELRPDHPIALLGRDICLARLQR